MIGYRQWRVADIQGQPVLGSVITNTIWSSNVMTADRRPGRYDEHGLYAVLPDSKNTLPGYGAVSVRVVGAVDAFGTVQIHEDGTVRAEHARILALRVLPNTCGDPKHKEAAYFNGKDNIYMYACPCWWEKYYLKVFARRIDLQELEAKLLERYGVPRLPDGVGPIMMI